MGIGKHLHLDMAGALDQLFQIDLVLAEGGLGLAACRAPGRGGVASSGMTRMPRPPPPHEAFSISG